MRDGIEAVKYVIGVGSDSFGSVRECLRGLTGRNSHHRVLAAGYQVVSEKTTSMLGPLVLCKQHVQYECCMLNLCSEIAVCTLYDTIRRCLSF